MDYKKRKANERKFLSWTEKNNGFRVYSYEVQGRYGWKARYVKEVDENDNTIKFYQEIYNDSGKLVEIHEKYPLDKGHLEV